MSSGRSIKPLLAAFGAAILFACSLPFLSRSLRAEEKGTTLAVEWLADSARLIARSSASCDSKGCADAYRFQWTATAASRTVTKAILVDTFYVTRPAVGDSMQVTVAVTAIRRGIASAPRTVSTWIRNPDAAPPRVDSVVIDTLALQAEAAFLDTFPTFEVRSSTGRLGMAIGESPQLCYFRRNRFTGEVVYFAPTGTVDERALEIAGLCEPARLAYQLEVSG